MTLDDNCPGAYMTGQGLLLRCLSRMKDAPCSGFKVKLEVSMTYGGEIKGDDRLSGTRYDWLRSRAAMQPADRREFDALRQSGLKTARAWALKETAMALYSYVYERPARKHFRWWWNWAQRSRLEPIKRVARMIKRRFENVIAYLRHRITNAGSESLNAKIQWVKYTARDFRNRQNFINAIYFHCGGLDMNPVPTTH